MTTKSPPRGFRLLLPDNWVRYDLDPETYRASLATSVDRIVADDPKTEVLAREAQGLLAAHLLDAIDHGALLAASYTDTINGVPIGASLVVIRSPYPADPGGNRMGLKSIADMFTSGLTKGRMVGLPRVGPAVLVTGREMVEEMRGTDGRPLQADTTRYFVPFPGQDSPLLVLSFSSPTLLLADAFRKLFRAIAESLNWQDLDAEAADE
ncbi:MAG: hypothetical protein ACJ73S_28995 [Mycobacteriales bacterium]